MIKCTFEDGHEALLRHVTVAAIIERGGKVLFERRSMGIVEGGKLCLPGGYLDRDETIEDAVAREVKEETGYIVKSSKLLTINDKLRTGEGHRQNVVFVHIADVEDGEPGSHDQESSEFIWFPLDALPAEAEVAFDHLKYVELYKQQ